MRVATEERVHGARPPPPLSDGRHRPSPSTKIGGKEGLPSDSTHLREPLFLYVLKRSRTRHAEADEEDVGLGVREGSEPVVVLLSRGIKEAEGVGVVPDHHRDGVVVEDGRDVFRWELVGGVAGEGRRGDTQEGAERGEE